MGLLWLIRSQQISDMLCGFHGETKSLFIINRAWTMRASTNQKMTLSRPIGRDTGQLFTHGDHRWETYWSITACLGWREEFRANLFFWPLTFGSLLRGRDVNNHSVFLIDAEKLFIHIFYLPSLMSRAHDFVPALCGSLCVSLYFYPALLAVVIVSLLSYDAYMLQLSLHAF